MCVCVCVCVRACVFRFLWWSLLLLIDFVVAAVWVVSRSNLYLAVAKTQKKEEERNKRSRLQALTAQVVFVVANLVVKLQFTAAKLRSSSVAAMDFVADVVCCLFLWVVFVCLFVCFGDCYY